MYLFVFIWVPSLQASSTASVASEHHGNLPLGYIFSAFMISMMLGSLSYTFITAHWHHAPSLSAHSASSTSTSSSTSAASVRSHPSHARSSSVASVTSLASLSGSARTDSILVLHAKLSSLVCALSALAFAASVSSVKLVRWTGASGGSAEEHVKFWAFCVFEGCVGMYYPVQGMLRGTLIADGYRATVRPFIWCPCYNCD